MRGWLIALLMLAAAPFAMAQATKPTVPEVVIDDSYQEKALPARRGATTHATGVSAAGGGAKPDELDFKRVGLALAIVLGAIYVTNRVWRKMGMPGAGGRASGSLQVVSRLSIAPKQQILLIRVGRRLVLVGNTGTNMSALTEIVDPEEAGGLIGQVAVEKDESSTASFHSVLGDQEKQFEAETNVDVPPGETPPADDPALATTRDELNGLMEKVRDLSKQFRRA